MVNCPLLMMKKEKMTMKKMSIFTMALSTTLTLAACSSPDEEEIPVDTEPETEETIDNESEEETNKELTTETENKKGLSTASLELTLDDAVNLFTNYFESQEMNIESIELKEKKNQYIYQLEGWDGQYEYELEFDAENSEILEEEKEKSDDEEEILNLKSAISPLEAMEVALELSKENAYVTEWELEFEDDQMIYDIDVENGEDQKIDALTGEVL